MTHTNQKYKDLFIYFTTEKAANSMNDSYQSEIQGSVHLFYYWEGCRKTWYFVDAMDKIISKTAGNNHFAFNCNWLIKSKFHMRQYNKISHETTYPILQLIDHLPIFGGLNQIWSRKLKSVSIWIRKLKSVSIWLCHLIYLYLEQQHQSQNLEHCRTGQHG